MRLTRREEEKKRKTEVDRRDFVLGALSRLQAWILAGKSRSLELSRAEDDSLSTGGRIFAMATIIYTTDALTCLTHYKHLIFDDKLCLPAQFSTKKKSGAYVTSKYHLSIY